MHVFGILVRLAWRNLWRNHRRTLIMLMAITLGTWAMIFMTALMRGMVTEVVRGGISALPGHVQVHHPDYRDDPSIANLIPVSDSELSSRFAAAGFVQWASRVRVPAVVTSEYDSRGVTLLGIDARHSSAASRLSTMTRSRAGSLSPRVTRVSSSDRSWRKR